MNIGGTDITQTTGKMALKTQKCSVNQCLVNGIIFEDRRVMECFKLIYLH